MVKRVLYISIILVFVFLSQLDAQRWKRTRYELLCGAGTLNAMTDLGGGPGNARPMFMDLDIQTTRFNTMVGVRYKLRELLALRMNILFGWVKASDVYTSNVGRSVRNVTASNPLLENSLLLEWSIQKERFGTRYTFSNMRRFNFRYVNVFIYAGLGGVWVPTTPASVPQNRATMGEGFHQYNLCFPMGVGLKYGVNRRLAFSMDIGHRYTTSDYLDGISDKNTESKDTYFMITFMFAYKLRTARSGLPKF